MFTGNFAFLVLILFSSFSILSSQLSVPCFSALFWFPFPSFSLLQLSFLLNCYVHREDLGCFHTWIDWRCYFVVSPPLDVSHSDLKQSNWVEIAGKRWSRLYLHPGAVPFQWEHHWPINMFCVATRAKWFLVSMDNIVLRLYVLLYFPGSFGQSVPRLSFLR